MSAQEQLQGFAAQLDALRAGTLDVRAFSTATREHGALLDALPPRFREVLLDLLDRLESSALFSEESCSFSQKDLLDALALWLEKARARLG